MGVVRKAFKEYVKSKGFPNWKVAESLGIKQQNIHTLYNYDGELKGKMLERIFSTYPEFKLQLEYKETKESLKQELITYEAEIDKKIAYLEEVKRKLDLL